LKKIKKDKTGGGGRINAWLAYARQANSFKLTKAVFK